MFHCFNVHFSLIKVLVLNELVIKGDFPVFLQTIEEEEGTAKIRLLVGAIALSTEYINAKLIIP